MKQCKNTECKNEVIPARTYCSLKCRNVFVNKTIRDYSKNKIGLTQKSISLYEQSPIYCKNPKCSKKLEYTKKRNDFCNSSCAAAYNNTIRVVNDRCFSKEGLANIRLANYKKRKPSIKNCIVCSAPLRNRRTFCNKICKRKFYESNKSDFEIYKNNCKFKFAIYDFPNEFDIELIKEHGWYSAVNRGNNLLGVSRDHMISIKYGYENNIDSGIISHPANCKLMVHNQNVSKHKKCSISLDELLLKIKSWNDKYGEWDCNGVVT